jgi:small subunit ribosomal protein S1
VTDEITPQAKPTSIADLKPKMRLQGTVKEVQLYGAVVDIGLEQDGLVHISQLAPSRTNRVTDIVKPGEAVTAWVTRVDPKTGRIGLTMVEPAAVDWSEISEGQTVTGKVTRLEQYGAFVDVGAERPGLLHVREMSSGYVKHPSELVAIGEEVEVRIAKIDRRKKRIDLSMIGLAPVIEDEEDQIPMQTSMEIALTRARDEKRGSSGRRRKNRTRQIDEREAILARTLRDHGQRD